MRSSSTRLPTPEGPGSVSGAPNLPAGLTGTFKSVYVNIGALRLHAVIGGDGPPLLLVHGWPETWYAWRLLMLALARDFSVVAVDRRGIGLSDITKDGYDTGTLADDLVKLMACSATRGSPWPATIPACRSATPWPPTTRTGSTAWPSPKARRRACLPSRSCGFPRRPTSTRSTSCSTISPP
jgi:hypothetical protein